MVFHGTFSYTLTPHLYHLNIYSIHSGLTIENSLRLLKNNILLFILIKILTLKKKLHLSYIT